MVVYSDKYVSLLCLILYIVVLPMYAPDHVLVLLIVKPGMGVPWIEQSSYKYLSQVYALVSDDFSM